MTNLRKLTQKMVARLHQADNSSSSDFRGEPYVKKKNLMVASQFSIYSATSTLPDHSPPALDIIIVGAGLGGLAAAISIARTNPNHKITILEQASSLGEVGAGIQVPPNSSKLLARWGLREKLAKESVYPKKFVLRRYNDGEALSGYYALVDESGKGLGGCEKDYGGPYWHIHRADYHRVLMEKAVELGVKIKLNSRVMSITFPTRSWRRTSTVHLSDNTSYTADLVIGADGLKSRCRKLLGYLEPPHNTGDLAYRILVSASDMRKYEDERLKQGLGPNDPGSLATLLEEPAITFWLGPDAHAVCYLLKGGGLYNIVLLCPDTLPAGQSVAPADLEEMTKLFETWDPRLKALLSIACKQQMSNTSAESTSAPTKSHSSTSPTVKVQKWRLQNSKELPTWTHPSGTFTLLGDACHATLPYLAQGAAMAIEDGAVLGGLIGKMQRKSQLPDVLSIYESIRKPRTTRVVQVSTLQRRVFHAHDGPEQAERDRLLKLGEEKVLKSLDEGRPEEQDGGKFPVFGNAWADKEFRDWLFAYDADREVELAWDSYLEHRSQKKKGILESMKRGLRIKLGRAVSPLAAR